MIMKTLIALLGMVLLTSAISAQQPDCKKIHTGKFESTIELETEKVVIKITRIKNKQIEENIESGLKMEFMVKWTSTCTYELSHPKVVSGTLEGVSDDQVIFVKVLEVKKDRYIAEVGSNFAEQKLTSEFLILKK